MSHLGVLVGFQEWDQIRHRRRRAIGDLIMAYLTTARLESGSFVAEALNLHRIDLDAWKGRLTLSPMPAATCQTH